MLIVDDIQERGSRFAPKHESWTEFALRWRQSQENFRYFSDSAIKSQEYQQLPDGIAFNPSSMCKIFPMFCKIWVLSATWTALIRDSQVRVASIFLRKRVVQYFRDSL